MRYISPIPVFNRVYTFGIREGKFLLSNIESRKDREWSTLPCDIDTIEGYIPLAANARNRLFLVSDESNTNTWVVVQSRLQTLFVDAPWREVMDALRVNLVDLGEGDYYIKHLALSYHMGMGNFYLYPEINPMNLPMKSTMYGTNVTRTVQAILDSVDEVYNLNEVMDYLPIGKLSRYRVGLLVTGPHTWWIDFRAKLAYYLNGAFFEDAISFRSWRAQHEEGAVDDGCFALPRERNSDWDSPPINAKMISGLLGGNFDILPASGTRIVTQKKATSESSGDYIIPGYGRFGRVALPEPIIAKIRSHLGSNLSLELRGNRFIAIYNISDIKAIYIRENAEWVEPVIKQPMAEELKETVADSVNEQIAEPVETIDEGILPHIGNFLPGWQVTGEHLCIPFAAAEPTPNPEPETLPATPEQPVAELEKDTVLSDLAEDWKQTIPPAVETFEQPQELPPEAPAAELDPAVVDVPKSTLSATDEKVTDDFTSGVNIARLEDYLNLPVFVNTYLEDHHDCNPTKMFMGEQYQINLPAPYFTHVPWERAEPYLAASAEGIIDGEMFSCANRTIIQLDGTLYVANMHINF